jgi:DNA-binding beta-propeller fold protein YncE
MSNPQRRSAIISLLVIMALAGSLLVVPVRTVQTQDGAGDQLWPITPAGSLVKDNTTQLPAVGSLTVNFVRSPDQSGPGSKGRYLIAVNSGYGIQFTSSGNRGQQSLAVIDLNARPVPAVIQNVYFPSPQSANVGVVFGPRPAADGTFPLYVSGGFENKIWLFSFRPDIPNPLTPTSPGPNTTVEAPFIDVSGFATAANSPRYNSDSLPVYPTGISISPDGNTLFVANNLADNLGIIHDLRGERRLEKIPLGSQTGLIYPYAVLALPYPPPNREIPANQTPQSSAWKVYVSCWNTSSIAAVSFGSGEPKVTYIPVGRHPTAMIWDGTRSRLYVVNSDDDSVSMIDTRYDREVERISVRLAENSLGGNSPEGLALDQTGEVLFVANAHSNSIAIVSLSEKSLDNSGSSDKPAYLDRKQDEMSRVLGFIPTGYYPSAVAVIDQTIFVGNGKGTGVENSSVIVNNSGRYPNMPNDRFPVGTGRGVNAGGQYSVSLVSGNISAVRRPEDQALARYTEQVMRNNGLIGQKQTRLFPGASPIKHVIYIIKENRTYDQVFGDVPKSGDGTVADGDSRLAIFGHNDAAARPDGTRQDISPNHRALAVRFGLFDRFFVNSEASPDGHNWSTAAFSTDYVDKAYRWNYSRRGRGYDFEGFNRLPNYEPVRGAPPLFDSTADAEDIANFIRRFVPYLQGSRDVAEPRTLYLWDAAARAGLTYRNYGEFLMTLSEADINAVRTNRSKSYPDLSPTVSTFATKKSLEGHFNSSYRNFDIDTPDAMTVDSYRAARESSNNPLIKDDHSDLRFRGNSRVGDWLKEFRGFVADLEAGRGDHLPNLSMLRLPNDHTEGLAARKPSPQFFMADNDYALGLLVEAVSNSPYWKDTAICVVEDDAQDGPDHIDAHRSVALVISAYNRPGALVHEFHTTVSLIRTIELLLGIAPMNQLDATATPINIFRSQPDLTPYKAVLPMVTLDNLLNPPARDAATAYWMKRTEEQDLAHADMADPEVLNEIIWFSVRGNAPMPAISRLPAFDALRFGLKEEREELAEHRRDRKDDD